MKVRRARLLLAFALACAQAPPSAAGSEEAVGELLRVATERALARFAGPEAEAGGAALPAELGPLARALHGTGMGDRVLELERALGLGAGRAIAENATWLEREAARFEPRDAGALLAGPPDAATLAFRAEVEDDLRERLRPAVERALGETGAEQALARVREGAARLPLPRDAEIDLVALTREQALAAFFMALAEEEGRIRRDPAARESAPLREAFGAGVPGAS
jgi:hypothetical protein